MVMEHKTSSFEIGLGSTYWKKLTLDAQISTYMVGARSLGFDPDGVLYDVLRKPALRPYEINSKRSVAESPEAYRDRILEDIAEKPDTYYQRGVVVRLKEEERDAAFDAWQTAEQIRLSRNSGRWMRNVDSCSMYNRMCEFWSVCSGTESISNPLRFDRGQAHRELDERARLPLLTSSSARTYRTCPKKYFFAYEEGARARLQAGALGFGTRVHEALAAWLTNGQSLESALAALRLPSVGYSYDDARAEAMLRGYHARWAGEPLEVLAVEREFACPLRNPDTGAASRTWMLGGKVDAIVRR